VTDSLSKTINLLGLRTAQIHRITTTLSVREIADDLLDLETSRALKDESIRRGVLADIVGMAQSVLDGRVLIDCTGEVEHIPATSHDEIEEVAHVREPFTSEAPVEKPWVEGDQCLNCGAAIDQDGNCPCDDIPF
jgi:hypothetical protein